MRVVMAARKRLQRPSTRLIELRLAKGMSRRDLAQATGISESGLRYIETAGAIPYPKHQLLIAQTLGAQPIDLWPLAGDKDEVAA